MKRIWLILIPLAAMLLAGCKPRGTTADADPVVRQNGVATLHITGNDDMRYNVTRFIVHAGEKVVIHFENVGVMPISTMGHDLVILKKGEDYKQFATEVEADRGPKVKQSVPEKMLDRVLIHTALLGPGGKETLEFTAPPAGEYPFLCTFPTHFVFMNGVMIVQ